MKSKFNDSRSDRRKKASQALRTAPAKSRLCLQVLEQRVLLDAAAAQTAQEAFHSAPPPAADPADAPDQHAALIDALDAVQQEQAVPAAAEPARTEVYFIDRSMAEADVLMQSLPAAAEVHFIDPQADGVEFIAQTLQGRSDIGAIHILSHGEAAALQLGTASLTAESMQGAYRDELAAIGRSLSAEGDILIYGCDFGQGDAGAEASQIFSSLTAADVAASTNDTGTASQGGDWVLERRVGAVETASVSAEQWEHLMTAPVLSTTPNLTYTGAEDAGAPVAGTAAGVLVSDYTVGMSDADADAAKGIAITGATTTSGTWWYSMDDGATWTQVGTVSTSSALLLADDGQTRLYYQPNANFNGSASSALTLRGWDQSAGTPGTKVNPSTISGAVSTTSDSVNVTVTAVNDAPVLVAATRNLSPISEDLNASTAAPAPTGGVGTGVPTFIGTITDSDTGSSTGIAIVGADAAHGTWWYSADNGTTWVQVGAVSDADAVLLANLHSSRVYFQPNGDFNGTATITIRAWDRTSGANGGRADASTNGGSTAFSSATGTATIAVNAVADIQADTLSGANSATEETPKTFNPITGTGGATADSFEGANPQITAIGGQAIAPGGTVTVTNGTVTLGADGQTLTFVGALDFTGNATFSYAVSSGGGAAETANITVAVTGVGDAPRLDLDSSTAGADFAGTIDQYGVNVGNLITLTDPENNNIASVSVTLSDATAADKLSAGALPSGISASYDSATGVLTLTGSSTVANYQAALNSVIFSTTSGALAPRTITVQATSATDPKPSNIAVATITPMDSDGDGVANAGDIDDDNDGLLDETEGASDVTYSTDGKFRATRLTGTIGGVGYTLTSTAYMYADPRYLWGTFPFDVDRRSPTFSNSTVATYTLTFDRPVNNPTIFFVSIGAFDQAVRVRFSSPVELALGRPVYGGSFVVNSPTQITGASADAVATFSGQFTSVSFDVLDAENAMYITFATQVEASSDTDSAPDRRDLDSDNDGLPDNVEAQATAGYRPPSGQGAGMVDADGDGLDDRYDGAVGDTSAATSIGLTPVDTDEDGEFDYLDADSDADGRADITERGDTQPLTVTNLADADNDGLLDIFEHGTENDGYFVHDGVVETSGSGLTTSVVNFNLADSDDDTAPDGNDAVALTRNLDWRDADPRAPRAPVIDLNSNVDEPDNSRDYSSGHIGSGDAVNVAASEADVSDFTDDDLIQMTIELDGILDGNSEVVSIGGFNFELGTDNAQTLVVDGTSLQVSYTVAGGFVITHATAGEMIPQTVLDVLVRGITYRHESVAARGTRTLTFVVSDSSGLSSGPAVATIQVPPNAAPIARNDSVTVPEDQVATGNVLTNDTDEDTGDSLSVVSFSFDGTAEDFPAGGTATMPGVGTITIGADGAYVFTPVLNYNGPVPAITYVVQDTAGNTAGAVLTVTIVPVNDPPTTIEPPSNPEGQSFDPVTGNYAATTMEDTVYSGQVSASDGDGNALTYSAGTEPAERPSNGTVTVDPSTGEYTYTPRADFNGSDSFVVNISDGTTTVQTTVTMTVTPVADAVNDTVTTNEDTDVTFNVLTDTSGADDFESAARTVTSVTNPAHGSVTFSADGSMVYTPDENFRGSDSFTYTVTSGGVTETATVTVNVTGVNDPPTTINPPGGNPDGQTFDPVTGNYAATTLEDTPFSGQVNASDADDDALTYSLGTGAANGTVTVTSSGEYTYTPRADFNGTDSFVVNISDGTTTVQSTVRMTVTPVADAVNDAVTTNEDTAVPFNVLTGADGASADNFESTARAVTRVTDPAHGSVTFSADGSVVYTPDENFRGSDSFTYTVTSGGVTETATVTVNVTGVNDPPTTIDPPGGNPDGQTFDPVTGNYAATTLEDTPFSGQVNASDADGDALTYSLGTGAANGTVTVTSSGEYTYTPRADFNGTDSFVVNISDGTTTVQTTVTMTVTPVPDAVDDTVTTNEDTPVVIDVNANDSFENPGHAVTAIDGAAIRAGGSVAVANGTVTLGDDGTLRFAPAANFNGTTRFSYTVTSGGVTETATVAVDLTGVNDPPTTTNPPGGNPDGQTFDPVTGNYAATTLEDTPFSGRVNASDADGDALTYSLGTGAANGTVTVTSSGEYTYTPRADFNGTDSFVVNISDGTTTVQTTVTMTVTPVPDAVDDTVTTNEDTPVVIDVNANDSFENPGHAVTAIDGAAIRAGGSVAVANGTVTLGDDGTLRFAPAANFNGTTRFSYTVTSGGVTETATVAVDLTGVNDPPTTTNPPGGNPDGQTFDPVTGNYAATTLEDTPFSGRVNASDADGDALTYSLGTGATNGTVTVGASGEYTYTPTSDFNGTDSFVIIISDGAATVQTTVTMTVTPVPDAVDDTVTTNEDTPVVIDVNANDSFENPGHAVTAIDGAAIRAGGSVAVANGTITLGDDGTLRFAPAANFNGTTRFSYTVSSGGVQETATVTVDVTAVNDPPQPVDPVDPGNPVDPVDPGNPVDPVDPGNPGTGEPPDGPGAPGQPSHPTFDPESGNYRVTTPQDVPFSGRVAATDPDGDELTYTVGASPSNGTVVLNPNGSYSYTPNARYVGSDSFKVIISDGNGGVVTSTVFITVTPLNQAARDDFPFVFYPGDDASLQDTGRDRRQGAGANGWQGAHIDVDPTVIQAVNGARSLMGTHALTAASGVVLQAVNGVQSLDGTAWLSADGAVLQAVNAVDSLNGSASYDRLESSVERAVQLADRADSTHIGFAASLRSDNGLKLELWGDRQQLQVSVDGGAEVREVRATLADGRPLPGWIRIDGSSGFLTMDRPADVEQIRLRLTVVPERGATRSQVIEFDFNAGQMRSIGTSEAPHTQRAPGSPHAGAAAVPDFAAQLDMAASGRLGPDAELLELMS